MPTTKTSWGLYARGKENAVAAKMTCGNIYTMKIATFLVVAQCVALVACTASINRVGPNIFVAESTYGEAGGIDHANQFCAKLRLAALVTTIIPSTERAYSKVYFKCLDPNSAEYRGQSRGPAYQPTPNVVIQDNRGK